MIMTLRKKKLMIILIVLLVLVAAWGLSYIINVQRLENGQPPLFVCHVNTANDGGTKIYYGLGYHIIEWNSMFENTALEKSDFAELTDIDMNEDTVYVCGGDIGLGLNYSKTVNSGPSPEHTIGFRFE